jgi:hypothetical protein
MSDHALLSPSGAARWLACPPSARLGERFPETQSTYAEEGTVAHALADLLIREKLGLVNQKTFKRDLFKLGDVINPETEEAYYNEEMQEICEDHALFVIEQYNSALAGCPDAKLMLEQRIDVSRWVPEGFGTSDHSIAADGELTVIDLKYGKGVPVNAYDNKQMMVYSLGVLERVGFLYDIRRVRMVICQPRLEGVSEFEMDARELLHWADEVLAPAAMVAWKGGGEYKAGGHCQFCRARAECRALMEYNLEIARHEFKEPALMTPGEMADVVLRASGFVKWIDAVKRRAEDLVLNHGHVLPGLKAVAGRSIRRWADQDAVEKALNAAGYANADIYNWKLLGITEMTRMLGKKDFDRLCTPHIVKPKGKPALVSADDPRAEINGLASALDDFKD